MNALAELATGSATPTDPPGASEPPEESGLARDAEFWYADGSIVLVAQRTAFRVYAGWLARRSEVFRDMLSIPVPPQPDGEQRVSGCPVVRLSDTSEALREFLWAVFFGGR